MSKEIILLGIVLNTLAGMTLVTRIGRGEYRIAELFLAEWIALNES
jgi:hypothetical protein